MPLLLRTAIATVLILFPLHAGAADLVVSAAVSLKGAFVEVGEAFRRRHPGDRIIFNFGASGELAQQIARGAPVDVFASAGTREMSGLADQHLLVSGSMKSFAGNRLVVVTPPAGKPVGSLRELAVFDRVAIGNPETVPAGRYAAEALKKEGIYGTLLARGKLIFAGSVRQALACVEADSVDAGLVYATDARNNGKARVSFVVPAALTEPILYPVALVKGSKHVELGRAFIDALVSESGQRILHDHGFLRAPK